ncbi:unnamed protein product [Didymodactylos carnosus]|uniref:Uncharacterized protein n=1 Tax=Didymodactylos carnosus TaxID=1234261 RepID=A0A814UZE7_9BILA|nr:unnamed protein product [Didymodactylos carnosus]CAF3946576.1 unnamed protein product [Didymodactylos carnosus]
MMALVPSTASTLARGTSNITNTTAVSSGNSGNADKVCGILQEIRDEFHTLKTYLVKNDKSSDQSNLNDVLNRTEHTIKERTDEVLNMLNGNIATLTFNQMAAVASGNNSSMFEQLYNLQTRDGSRKLTFMPNGNNRQSEYSIPSIPVITIGPSSNQQPRIAPGMAAKMEYESKIIRNPFNQKNRQVLYDNFGIQLPLIERQQQKQVGHLIK